MVVSSNSLRSEHKGRVLFTCLDFSIGGHSSYILNLGRALRERQFLVGALAAEPFGELYEEFGETLHQVEIVRRGLETRDTYLRRLLRRIVDWRLDMLVNSAIPMVQALLPFLPEEVLRISTVHSVIETPVALANIYEMASRRCRLFHARCRWRGSQVGRQGSAKAPSAGSIPCPRLHLCH